jgi:pSer/pThr/pTyr-binding forkhead associated (FHA) protein
VARSIQFPVTKPNRQNSMKSFLAACGIEDSFQFTVENQNATESKLRLLYQPFAVIGRDLRADVVLDHVDVSRRHVYLQVVEGRVFWIDLESRTGTRGERESQRFGWLEGGRTFGVGPYVIRRFLGDGQTLDKLNRNDLPRDTPLVARAHAHAAQSEVTLEFLNGPSQSMFKPVHRVLSLIGSAGGCKFRLTDSSVSRFHSSLLQTSAGLWIVDLLGQKGITINDVPVRSSRLVDGDIVRIGRYQIRVRCRPRAQRSESGSFDLGRAAFVPRQAHQSRAPIDLKSTNWLPVIAPSRSDALDGQEPSSLPIQAISIPPKVDLVPSNSILPINLTQSELTESMLVPLVNQFGLMQQQMFDQFQQAMSMMIQMFGTMHRDQMEVIRGELDQLRELTDEFHALRNELARRTQNEIGAISREPELNLAGLNQPDTVDSHDLAPPLVMPSKPKGNLEVRRVGEAPAPSPMSLSSKIIGQQLSPESDTFVTQSSASPPAPSSNSEPIVRANLQPSAKASSTGPEPDSDRATVLWLHQRIMTLQRERESRWQKVLKLVPGMFSS